MGSANVIRMLMLKYYLNMTRRIQILYVMNATLNPLTLPCNEKLNDFP